MANEQKSMQDNDSTSAEKRIKDNNEDPASWRPSEPGASATEPTTTTEADAETGDPGRTPGSAEGVEGFQQTGNE